MTICNTRNDTHRMRLSRDGDADLVVMCTRCPTPCQECRAGGNGPYCERTPCSCVCHRPEAERAAHALVAKRAKLTAEIARIDARLRELDGRTPKDQP